MTLWLLLALAVLLALAGAGWLALELPPERSLPPAGRAPGEVVTAPALVRRASRPAVVLAHGLAGFDSIGVGELRIAYFRRAAETLERAGYDVITTRVPATGALPLRAAALTEAISRMPHERVTIVAHSMGGLDARWAICHGLAARVAALVAIGTPHRGTPLADILARGPAARARAWAARLGLPTDAIDWLTTWRLAELAPQMADVPEVRYTSVVGVAARTRLHPLLLAPHFYLSLVAGANDGMVPESSQRWGEVLAEEPLDHFAQIGWSRGGEALIERSLSRLRALPCSIVELAPAGLPSSAP
jgi:triacylglycerol lipase